MMGEILGIYEKTTQNVTVRVEPDYLEDQSRPADDHYIWAYTVEIENNRQTQIQLVERFWQISDSRGQCQEIRGSGVMGQTPILKPGEVFRYTSGAPLYAPSGMMRGTYSLKTPNGDQFDVTIPTFLLDSPHETQSFN